MKKVLVVLAVAIAALAQGQDARRTGAKVDAVIVPPATKLAENDSAKESAPLIVPPATKAEKESAPVTQPAFKKVVAEVADESEWTAEEPEDEDEEDATPLHAVVTMLASDKTGGFRDFIKEIMTWDKTDLEGSAFPERGAWNWNKKENKGDGFNTGMRAKFGGFFNKMSKKGGMPEHKGEKGMWGGMFGMKLNSWMAADKAQFGPRSAEMLKNIKSHWGSMCSHPKTGFTGMNPWGTSRQSWDKKAGTKGSASKWGNNWGDDKKESIHGFASKWGEHKWGETKKEGKRGFKGKWGEMKKEHRKWGEMKKEHRDSKKGGFEGKWGESKKDNKRSFEEKHGKKESRGSKKGGFKGRFGESKKHKQSKKQSRGSKKGEGGRAESNKKTRGSKKAEKDSHKSKKGDNKASKDDKLGFKQESTKNVAPEGKAKKGN